MRTIGAAGVLVQAGFVACVSDASDSIFNSRTVEESTSDTRQPLFTLYTAFIEASFWFPIFQTVQHWDFLRITFTALYILHHPTYKTQSWHEDRHSLIEWAWALFPEQASNIFCGWFHKHVEFAMMSNQKRGAYMVLTSYGWFRIWKDLLPVSTCPGMELPVLPEKLEDSHRVPSLLLNEIYWNL